MMIPSSTVAQITQKGSGGQSLWANQGSLEIKIKYKKRLLNQEFQGVVATKCDNSMGDTSCKCSKEIWDSFDSPIVES